MFRKATAVLFHKKIRGLHAAAYLLGGFTLLSQALAVFRDRMLAHNFGAGEILDAYYLAFRIPDLVYVSVASVVATTILIPFFTEKEQEEGSTLREFISRVFTTFALFIVFASAVVFVLLPYLASLIAPGLSEEGTLLLVDLGRILLLSPVILGVSALFTAITHHRQMFFVSAMSPVLYNAGIIVGIVFLAPTFGIFGVAWGVVIGALMHMSVQIPVVISQGLLPRIVGVLEKHDIRKIFLRALPRMFTLMSSHIVAVVLLAFASLVSAGAITVYSFAYSLQSIPLSLIAVSYSVAAFPVLSRLFARGEHKAFFFELVRTRRYIFWYSALFAAGLIILRVPIVSTVFETGMFDQSDVLLTASVLAIFAVSVPAQGVSLLYTRAFYAQGNTRTPLLIQLFSGVTAIAIAYILLRVFQGNGSFFATVSSFFDLSGVVGAELVALPLAFSFASYASMAAFVYMLKR